MAPKKETTEQEKVTQQLRKAYGPTANAEDHGDYKLVKIKREGKYTLVGIGDTWELAIRDLERKAK